MGALDFSSQPPNLAPDKPLAATKPTAAPAPAPEAKPEEKPAASAPVDPTAGIGKAMAASEKKIDALNAQAMQLKPPQINLPPKPEPKHTSPVEQWGSFAMMFAALGGLLSRNHLTTALGAMTAAMNGFKEKDKAATDQAMKQWESETKNAMDLINFQNKAYEQALGNIRHSEDLELRRGTEGERVAKAKMDALSTAFSDPAMKQASQQGLSAMVDLQKKRDDAAAKLAEEKIKVSKGYAGMQARDEYMASDEYADADPMERLNKLAEIEHQFGSLSGRGSATMQPLPPDSIDLHAQRMAALQEGVPSPGLMRNPTWREAYDKAVALNPRLEPNQYTQINDARKALTSVKPTDPGATLAAMGKLTHHIPTLESLAQNIPNESNVQAFNNWAAKLSAEIEGNPQIPSFEVAKQVVSAELLKAIASATGGDAQLRDKYENLVNEKMNKGQIAGAISVMKELVNGQLVGLKEKYENALPQDKDGKLMPAAQQLVDQNFPPRLMDAFKPAQQPKKSGEVAKADSPKPVEISHPEEALQVPNGSPIKLPNGAVVPMSDEIREKLKKMMGQ